MNRRQRVTTRGRGRLAQGGFGWLALIGVSCLPTEDLSNYSRGGPASAPGEAALNSEGAPGAELPNPAPSAAGAAADGAAADGVLDGAAPPLSAPGEEDTIMAAAPATQCGSECGPPALSQDFDGGTAPSEGSPSGAEPGGDAGPARPAADAGPASACPPGATVGPDQRCFALLSTPNSWQGARELCRDIGAGWDLATIHDPQRNALLTSLLGTLTDAWLGATDAQNEGEWLWVDEQDAFWSGDGVTGNPADGAYVNWTEGTNPEPNGGDASDCLRLRPGGGWADLQCTTPFAAICEGPQL